LFSLRPVLERYLEEKAVMDKRIKDVRKTASPPASFLRTAWLSILLLVVAGAMVAAGVYLRTRPEWTLRGDIRDYNMGVLTCRQMLWGPLVSSEESLLSVYPHVIENAGGRFAKVAEESRDRKLRSLALYNLGTLTGRAAFFHQQLPGIDLGDAIAKLTDAIRNDPDNEDAKYNKELLERVLTRKGNTKAGPGAGYSPGAVNKGF
jgi:hypothetical protein